MYILIIGGGKTGAHLADILLADNHEVTIVENRPEIVARLESDLPTVSIVQGDGCDPFVLENAGIARADVVTAATGDDEDNLVVSTLAKRQYGVRRVIARVNNHKNEWLFTKDFGVDVAVSRAHIIAKLIEEETAIRDIVTLLKLRRGDVALLQETLQEGDRAVGKQLMDLGLPKNCVVVTILRGNEVLLPSGDTVFQAGDEILAVANVACEASLQQVLNG